MTRPTSADKRYSVKLDDLDVGTVVLAQGGTRERIIGIVTGTGDMPEVIWISDRRGIFACNEAPGDLIVAPLKEREALVEAFHRGEGDRLLDHKSAAIWIRCAREER